MGKPDEDFQVKVPLKLKRGDDVIISKMEKGFVLYFNSDGSLLKIHDFADKKVSPHTHVLFTIREYTERF